MNIVDSLLFQAIYSNRINQKGLAFHAEAKIRIIQKGK